MQYVNQLHGPFSFRLQIGQTLLQLFSCSECLEKKRNKENSNVVSASEPEQKVLALMY